MPQDPVTSAELEWRNGVPYPVRRPIITRDQMKQERLDALSAPYRGVKVQFDGIDEFGFPTVTRDFKDDFEREMDGRPCFEVRARRIAQKAAEGDNDLIKYDEDRWLGKPVQTNENLNVTMSFTDALDQIMLSETMKPLPPPPDTFIEAKETTEDYHIIEIEPEHAYDSLGDLF